MFFYQRYLLKATAGVGDPDNNRGEPGQAQKKARHC
jgi:hypothetical protein